MKKSEKDFLNKFDSLNKEMFDKLDQNINYNQYKKETVKKMSYKYILVPMTLVVLVVLGYFLKPKGNSSLNNGKYQSTQVQSQPTITTGNTIWEVFIGWFSFQGFEYEFYQDADEIESSAKLDELGEVEVTGSFSGTHKIYRYNAGLNQIIIEIDGVCYVATCQLSKTEIVSIEQVFKDLYNLKDDQMDGSTQSFIKTIKLKNSTKQKEKDLDSSVYDEIFYGIIESSKVEKNRRKENIMSSTAMGGYAPIADGFKMIITTVDDLQFIISFTKYPNEPIVEFRFHNIKFNMSQRMRNVVESILFY